MATGEKLARDINEILSLHERGDISRDDALGRASDLDYNGSEQTESSVRARIYAQSVMTDPDYTVENARSDVTSDPDIVDSDVAMARSNIYEAGVHSTKLAIDDAITLIKNDQHLSQEISDQAERNAILADFTSNSRDLAATVTRISNSSVFSDKNSAVEQVLELAKEKQIINSEQFDEYSRNIDQFIINVVNDEPAAARTVNMSANLSNSSADTGQVLGASTGQVLGTSTESNNNATTETTNTNDDEGVTVNIDHSNTQGGGTMSIEQILNSIVDDSASLIAAFEQIKRSNEITNKEVAYRRVVNRARELNYINNDIWQIFSDNTSTYLSQDWDTQLFVNTVRREYYTNMDPLQDQGGTKDIAAARGVEVGELDDFNIIDTLSRSDRSHPYQLGLEDANGNPIPGGGNGVVIADVNNPSGTRGPGGAQRGGEGGPGAGAGNPVASGPGTNGGNGANIGGPQINTTPGLQPTGNGGAGQTQQSAGGPVTTVQVGSGDTAYQRNITDTGTPTQYIGRDFSDGRMDITGGIVDRPTNVPEFVDWQASLGLGLYPYGHVNVPLKPPSTPGGQWGYDPVPGRYGSTPQDMAMIIHTPISSGAGIQTNPDGSYKYFGDWEATKEQVAQAWAPGNPELQAAIKASLVNVADYNSPHFAVGQGWFDINNQEVHGITPTSNPDAFQGTTSYQLGSGRGVAGMDIYKYIGGLPDHIAEANPRLAQQFANSIVNNPSSGEGGQQPGNNQSAFGGPGNTGFQSLPRNVDEAIQATQRAAEAGWNPPADPSAPRYTYNMYIPGQGAVTTDLGQNKHQAAISYEIPRLDGKMPNPNDMASTDLALIHNYIYGTNYSSVGGGPLAELIRLRGKSIDSQVSGAPYSYVAPGGVASSVQNTPQLAKLDAAIQLFGADRIANAIEANRAPGASNVRSNLGIRGLGSYGALNPDGSAVQGNATISDSDDPSLIGQRAYGLWDPDTPNLAPNAGSTVDGLVNQAIASGISTRVVQPTVNGVPPSATTPATIGTTSPTGTGTNLSSVPAVTTNPTAAPVDYTAVARDVISGKYYNGIDREKALLAKGYDPKAVQAEVNRIMLRPGTPAPATSGAGASLVSSPSGPPIATSTFTPSRPATSTFTPTTSPITNGFTPSRPSTGAGASLVSSPSRFNNNSGSNTFTPSVPTTPTWNINGHELDAAGMNALYGS